jgi:hypothetical protein
VASSKGFFMVYQAAKQGMSAKLNCSLAMYSKEMDAQEILSQP